MKFHLPLLLRKALLLSLCVCAATTAYAGVMHEDVNLQTYTDFGQNKGRYVVGDQVNALLQHIREEEGGIAIPYTEGSSPFIISNEQGMINFSSTGEGGPYAAIAPNVVVTVLHNGSVNGAYGDRVVGENHAINYSAIDIRSSSVFRCAPIQTNGDQYDYMLQRQSKIVTDAVCNPVTQVLNVDEFKGDYLYHAGGGTMYMYHEGDGAVRLNGEYQYIIGGINTITDITWNDGPNMSVISDPAYGDGRGACTANPLPNGIRPGDSGSPVFIYNTETKQYEYVAAQQSGGSSSWSQARGNVEWTHEALESFNARVAMSEDTSVVYLNAVDTAGETKTDGTHSTTLYSGAATDASGKTLVDYIGVQSGLNTWADLSGVKDQQNWYAYDSDAHLLRSDADLYFTNNLVFTSSAAENDIVLNDTVDLGIGYAEFNGGKFTIRSAAGESNTFNHAGYVINAGAEVHLELTNPENYMREWRKSGAGDLYIDGKGDTNALLNVGGSGTTYLQQSGGHAAYNVLANTGARVVIQDLGQIERDFTFGAGGGELDMNGLSMDWYTSTDADGRFTINALTEEAVISNHKGHSTLTYKEGGNQTYLGSFHDTKDSSLRIDYQGGGKLTLNSIHTNLSNNAASGLTVSNGTVVLTGTNTEHGIGSATGTNRNRLLLTNDWHYADASMDVLVKNGGTFELGSHARLTGDVTVQAGGTFLMREGVTNELEYVEGGVALENTSKYAAYYGHKGNVELNGGTFAVLFNEGVDANTNYAGNVSGSGAMIVDAGGDGASFTFSGTVENGISKTVVGGTLILSGAAASDFGSGQWLVQGGGQMSIDNIDMIDAASTGTLVIGRDTLEQVDMGSYSNMLLGAQGGTELQYGVAGTSETLRSLNLGGSGSLIVNYVLSGNSVLTVDGRGNSAGSVKLQQIASDYTGTLSAQSAGGRMVLDVGDAALRSVVNVNEGGVLRSAEGSISGSAGVIELRGAMEYDSFTVRDGATLNLRAGGRLDSSNAVTIAGGGIMRLNTSTLQDKVELKNGGIMYGNGGTIGTSADVLATEGTGKLNANGGAFTVNGQIGAAEGAALRLENGTFNIYTGEINSAGGTLELACSRVNLGHEVVYATQNIGGTLSIAANLTINFDQKSYDKGTATHNINHLHIEGGHKLTMEDPSSSYNHIYNISSLTGRGEIQWNSNPYWSYLGPSRMVLTGDNSFEGALIVNQTSVDGSVQHLCLAHDNAAKNMVINLWGKSNSRPGLAISTGNAHLAGLGGTAHTFVYAGAVKSNYDGENPTSTARNMLTIDTKGKDHTYNGTLLGDAGNGLDIVKTGAGTQTFTGADNVVHDVAALEGHLNFTAAPTVHGDLSIAQGARLTIGRGEYNLLSGQTINVLGGASGQSAIFSNDLYVEGGTINFGVYDSSAYALHLDAGYVGGTHMQLSFSNTDTIEMDTRYLLADGDWSWWEPYVNVKLNKYLNADLNYSGQGLSVVFTSKDGFTYWNGDASGLNSQSELVLGLTGSDSMPLAQDCSVKGLCFASSNTFTVSAENGAALDTDYVEIGGGGTLVVDAELHADTVSANQSNTLTGSGKIRVNDIDVQKGVQTTVEGLTVTVENSITGGGVLSMDSGSFLHVDSSVSGNVQLTNGSTLVAEESSVATNLTLGESGEDSRVSLRMGDSSGVALNGSVAVQGNTTLSVQGSGALQFNSAFNKLAALELQSGVNLALSSEVSTHLVLDGGSATLSGDNNQILDGNVTVKSGGVLSFSGTGADIIDYNKSGRSLTVSGGTIDFGTTRQTMGDWSLLLSDGAVVTGPGNATYGALDFNLNDSTIYATSGESIISAVTRLRSGHNLNYDISEGATLTVAAAVRADGGGSLTKEGEGKLVLSAANTYTNTTTINGGTLSTSVNGALGTSSVVINEGGTLLLGGDNNKLLGENVTINAGGTLRFDGTGADIINYDKTGKTLTVSGGTIDFGTARQTMGGWTITLSDGATLTGQGNATYGALDFNLNNSTIYVTSGDNTISAVTRLRNGNNLNYDVSGGAALTISGLIHSAGSSNKGSITKCGAGQMLINSGLNLNYLSTRGGEVVLTGTQNTVAHVDGAMENSNTAEGTLRLAQDARLQITGNIWGRSNTGIFLDSGAELNISGRGLTISNRSEKDTASLAATTVNGPGEYTLGRTTYEISNAHVTYTGGDATINNKLTNSAIENAGAGILKVDNAGNSLSGVHATGGSIKLFSAAELDLKELEIATSLSVSAYVLQSEKSAQVARINVSEIASFGAGATLNADLVMKAGATLQMADTVQLGRDLSINGTVTLRGGMLEQILTADVGETFALFTGVDNLYLNGTKCDSVSLSNTVSASVYFAGLENSNGRYYWLTYNSVSIDEGVLSVLITDTASIPEPATATLSLLALASLAARRRRKA